MFFWLCWFQNVGDLETIPEDPVEMNGAGHTSRKGSTSNEFDVVRKLHFLSLLHVYWCSDTWLHVFKEDRIKICCT